MNKRIKKKKQKQRDLRDLDYIFSHLLEILDKVGELNFGNFTIKGEKGE